MLLQNLVDGRDCDWVRRGNQHVAEFLSAVPSSCRSTSYDDDARLNCVISCVVTIGAAVSPSEVEAVAITDSVLPPSVIISVLGSGAGSAGRTPCDAFYVFPAGRSTNVMSWARFAAIPVAE